MTNTVWVTYETQDSDCWLTLPGVNALKQRLGGVALTHTCRMTISISMDCVRKYEKSGARCLQDDKNQWSV